MGVKGTRLKEGVKRSMPAGRPAVRGLYQNKGKRLCNHSCLRTFISRALILLAPEESKGSVIRG